MPKSPHKYLFAFFSFHIYLVCISEIHAQDTYFKFPVTQSGVYQITDSQIQSLGLNSNDGISIFGYPGVLPQLLDSSSIEMTELPLLRDGNRWLYYLEGPDVFKIEDGKVSLERHLYADTVYYLLGNKKEGKLIQIKESADGSGGTDEILNLVQGEKWEETNILNSGRQWYSLPIFNGQVFRYPLQFSAQGAEKINLSLGLMAQGFQESTFRLSTGGQALEQVTIAPIPNTTYGIKGREAEVNLDFEIAGTASQNLVIQFQSGDINAQGFLDYIIWEQEFQASRLVEGIYVFKEIDRSIRLNENLKYFEVSDPLNVIALNSQTVLNKDSKIIAYNPNNILTISNLNEINSSLRQAPEFTELIVISPTVFASQAQRLCAHKRQLGMSCSVAFLPDIFDNFGFGTRDITAVRNFLFFHYHKGGKLKNVLFLGKGTFDHKSKLGGRPNLVPTYSSRNSLNPLTTYSSDDYFGFLEFGQGVWNETASGDEELKIGVGRIPAINNQEVRRAIDKIITYETMDGMEGFWKKNVAFFADDGDNNIHLRDAESHSLYLQENHPEFLVQKLYLDRFEQIKTNGAQSSPQARQALRKSMDEGLLLFNFIGHGNETTLTAERIFTVSDIADWPENPRLPLFVTATCEFGRHDSPFIRSGAEELLIAERKGAIALLTTGRPVFSSVNFTLNKAFIESVFKTEMGQQADLGTIFQNTKNNSLNGPFNRNFSLLGDPSLKLAVPELDAKKENITDLQLELEVDNLNAGQQVSIKGKIIDPVTDAHLISAQGRFQIEIRDKPQIVSTLGDESPVTEFKEENILLFRGEGIMEMGEFISMVQLPKNMDTEEGIGTIRLFADLESSILEAMGAERINIGGIAPMIPEDMEGPIISFLYGEELIPGPAVFPFRNLPFRIEFEDESGINISNFQNSQDIRLFVNDGEPISLNEQYLAIDGGFQRGRVDTFLNDLKEGMNTIIVEAYDNLGNFTQHIEQVEIQGSQRIRILSHTSYPNPAIDFLKIKLSHNRPQENLFLKVEIYSMHGHKIFQMENRYIGADFNLDVLDWNFFHSKTKYPAKGIYIYRLLLSSENDGSSDTSSGKIIIQ